ncbi:MAG: energy transducer TonB [Bacteroidia bacterium]|nr:energy transducer TonB [Bacteroidia bacterium]
MRHFFSIIACIFLPLALLSQNLGYEVQSTYKKAVKEEQLHGARTMLDINPGYPQNWIKETDYISSELVLNDQGKVIKALGNNDILNSEQQSVLKMAEIGSNIDVAIKYYSENVVTKERVVNTMSFRLSLIPEIEASYPGGYDELKAYLKKQVIDVIGEEKGKKIDLAKVKFAINTHGKACDARISESSGSQEIDRLLLESVARMPAWKPAQDVNGKKIKQEFEFIMGMKAGC